MKTRLCTSASRFREPFRQITGCARFFRSRGAAPEFEHAGDGAEEHLPRPRQGGFARGNFVRSGTPHCSGGLTECYELAGNVGKGAFGAVCIGKDRKNGTEVAIKTIPKSSIQSPEQLRMEIEFLRLADHPNVARLFEVFEDESQIHLILELCSGGELWQRILSAHESGLGFSEAELAHATRQMLRAIAYCHSHSIVHRDIKPENFLFASKEPDAPLKLVDFGIGGVVPGDREEARFLTAMVGTDGYMAPEILLSRPYGPSVDLFSVGAVMHAALVGLPPRWDLDKQAYTFPGRMRWRMLSKGAQSLLARLLDADPGARPTAREALQDPWLQEHAAPAQRQALDSPELLERLRNFGQRTKLEQAARMALVALGQLRSEEAQALQAAFLQADTDCTGEVTRDELAAVLQHCGRSLSDLDEVCSALDCSRQGRISYSEWMAGAASHAWLSDNERARKAFSALDRSGDGFISPAEVQAALPGVYTDDELAKEIERLDSDGDGKLNFEEFCKLLQTE
eukprot:TRINITY_DN11542_c0_g1_i1.p1 TRINITY_DN11542_c0_g1~~TRINITY_DN11542_c0_g1_i1.p1  ORF type:complete len:529 (-),score=100.73 TRINITY_DN11542_c0_g1_i1:301-1839(-)